MKITTESRPMITFENWDILDQATQALSALEAIKALTEGNLVIVPWEDPTGNRHHKLVPAQRRPAEEEAAGPFKTGARDLYRKVTNVEFDYTFVSIWLKPEGGFHLQDGKVIALYDKWKDGRVTVATISTKIYHAKGVVMDGQIYPSEEWTEAQGSWEELTRNTIGEYPLAVAI